MAQQTLNPPPVRSPFTTGDSSEKGDTPNDLVTKLTTMLTELYAKALQAAKFTSSALAGPATAAAGDLTGAQSVVCNYTGFGANNLTTRTAAQMFADMGAGGFTERATRELRATGERVRKRTADPVARLTAREALIARLAGDGLSNPGIAAQLFMSPRTVEYHLHKVFTKLDITSRNQLRDALASQRNEGQPQAP